MKVLNFLRPENGMTEDPLYYMNFEKYENDVRDCYFFMADFSNDLFSGRYDDKEKIVLTLEEPNSCTIAAHNAQFHLKADKILTLCPYTADLFENRTLVFFPFSEDWIPEETEKVIDVSYFGSIETTHFWRSYIQNVFTKYNFRYGHYNMGNVPRCSYQDKLKILSQSKISVVHGLWRSLSAEGHMQFPRASENLAFSHLDEGIGPQVKSRMFEAAFSRCVILCQRDYWNPIELWFEPEKEFMYFDNEKDLDEKINYIINHYDEFDDMRINAYNKAINNYTTKHFVDRYLK